MVVEESPYAVSLSPPATALARDGAIELVATVDRARGFDEAIEVSLPYLPPGVEMDGPAIVPAGRTEASCDSSPVRTRTPPRGGWPPKPGRPLRAATGGR